MRGSLFGSLTPQRYSKVVLWIGLIALLILVTSPSAPAQTDRSEEDVDSPGLTIEAVIGWDGTVDRSTPIPVSFLIRNESDHIIEGLIRLSDHMTGHEATLGEVVVAPGTARRLTSIQAMTDWYQCFATLSDGKRVLWRRELALMTVNEFNANINYALFIDDGERRLQLPGPASGVAAMANSEPMVAGEQGRPVECLTVKTWQVPNHPGPLVAAQAMIFPESADDSDLNEVQWRAVAEWMCQGGTVFVHKDSQEIVNRLIDSAPLGAEPARSSGPFAVRRAGLGAIYQYSQPLLPSAGSEIRQRLAETIAKLKKSHITALVDSANLYYWRGGRADLNRVLVVAFFGLYTFFSGVVALLLFRLSQRRMGAYTLIVVVGASVLSGLLGAYLRFSRGDLHWVTVTQAGAGGVVQVGRIEVQSAGGRNTHVAVNGEHVDLQFLGGDRGYYPWRRMASSYPPFTWQPNLASGVDDTYQVNVPMTPWGRRRLQATAYRRDVPRLDFELEFEPRPSAIGNDEQKNPGMPSGVFSLKLVNRLPIDLTECWLVVGVTGTSSDPADFMQSSPYETLVLPAGSTETGSIDVYQIHPLQELSAGEIREDAFDAQFQVMRNDWDLAIPLPYGRMSLPRISHLGAASAWIVARIKDSDNMTIDEQHSDFVTLPDQSLHLFIQEILPEDMPDASLFIGADPDAPSDAVNGTR
jgi:hypothetical protein